MQRRMNIGLRMTRPVYWVGILLLLSSELLISKYDQIFRIVNLLLWLTLYTLRLRDAHRPIYLGAIVMSAEAALIIGPAIFVPEVFLYYVEGGGNPPRFGGEQILFFASVGAGLLLQVIFAVWLGLVNGRRSSNDKAAADHFS